MAIFLEVVFLICFYLGAAMLKQFKISYFFEETVENLCSKIISFFPSYSGWAYLLKRALTKRSSYIILLTVIWAGHCWASSPGRVFDSIILISDSIFWQYCPHFHWQQAAAMVIYCFTITFQALFLCCFFFGASFALVLLILKQHKKESGHKIGLTFS